jgi:hypothetical protein
MLPIKTVPQRGKAKVNLRKRKVSKKGQKHTAPPALPHDVPGPERAVEAVNHEATHAVHAHEDTDIDEDRTTQDRSFRRVSLI